MVEVRTWFSGWHLVTLEKAYKIYNIWAAGAAAIPEYNKKEYFNRLYIRGGAIE